MILHGTTVTTNALLTGTGARVGLLTTKGFRDILEMRRATRESLYDNKATPPPPLVPRYLRLGVEERIDAQGQEAVLLNERDLIDALSTFKEQGVEAIAISFLHAYANPAHENRAARLIAEQWPDVYLSISSEVLPQISVYERTSTTVLNSYCGPKLRSYLSNLQKVLSDEGFLGTILIMQSNGGMTSPKTAEKYAVHSLLSGPAAGVSAGIYSAGLLGFGDCVSLDMGGTSCDVCLTVGGSPMVSTEGYVARYRVMSPMLDINTIGAGGGSIAWVDSGRVLRVGPQSAGASPGPVCYGFGGTEPTVTDANLVLGYIEAGEFFGGRMKLDVAGARETIQERVAAPLGLGLVEAAYGIHTVVNTNMALAVRQVSVERGYDPRDFALVVGGGAGPIHACALAQELGCRATIVPRDASAFSAFGMLLVDVKHDYVRTYKTRVDRAEPGVITALFADMKRTALETLAGEQIEGERVGFVFELDLRYVGQYHEIKVEASEDEVANGISDQVVDRFHAKHGQMYGYSVPSAGVEVINLRLTAIGRTERPEVAARELVGSSPERAIRGTRDVYIGGLRRFVAVPVYDGQGLSSGNVVEGPAVIQHPTFTVILDMDHEAGCDRYGNYLIYPKAESERYGQRIAG